MHTHLSISIQLPCFIHSSQPLQVGFLEILQEEECFVILGFQFCTLASILNLVQISDVLLHYGTLWSSSKWRISTSGTMDGRPWAHWKGSWQEDKDATKLEHSSLLRESLNLMAPEECIHVWYHKMVPGLSLQRKYTQGWGEVIFFTVACKRGEHFQNGERQSSSNSACWAE